MAEKWENLSTDKARLSGDDKGFVVTMILVLVQMGPDSWLLRTAAR